MVLTTHFSFDQLVVEYLHHHATLASTVVLNQAPTIDVSATIGTSTFAMGALAAYETSSSIFTNFIVGIKIQVPNATASIILYAITVQIYYKATYQYTLMI